MSLLGVYRIEDTKISRVWVKCQPY